MSRHEDLSRVIKSGIVAVIRSTSSEQLVDVARALYEGGVDVLEVTFTVPRALEIISALHKALGDNVLLGAGPFSTLRRLVPRFWRGPSFSFRRPSISM